MSSDPSFSSLSHQLLPSAQSVDLTNCDREPIHIPGGIQPQGVLLALDESDFSITQISLNTQELLGLSPEQVLGSRLEQWLEADVIAQLRRFLERRQLDNNPVHLVTGPFAGRGLFEMLAHRYGGVLQLELELPANFGEMQAPVFFSLMKAVEGRLHQTGTILEFCQATAEEVRALTGYDRVMVYKFDPDGHGHVLAEDKRDDLEAFLNLHYPESDIPKQARAMALITSVRYLPDVYYQAVPITPLLNLQTGAPLDMTCCSLRSMSRMYTDYLINMKVSATLTVSLIKDGKLWGLIACHHYSGPRFVPYDVRMACEFLGRAVSLLLSAKEEQEYHDYREKLRATTSQFIERMLNQPFDQALLDGEPNVLDFVAANGAAVSVEGRVTLTGQTPPEAQVRKLAEWVAGREAEGQTPSEGIWHTNSLVREWPGAETMKETASGVLAVSLAGDWRDYVLWFRPEVLQTVNWAGDPRKPVDFDSETQRLMPRGSFALWKETVRDSAEPWTPPELEAAAAFRHAIRNIVLSRAVEIAQLNRALEQSNDELRSFAYVASHDLKEPLRGIHNYSHFLLEDYEDKLDDEGKSRLNTLIRLTQRMEALLESLLYYSRVGRDALKLREVDSAAEVRDALAILQPRLEEKGFEVRVPRSLPPVLADPARVGEIWMNLLTNAIKYNDKTRKWIEIGYEMVATPNAPQKAQPVFYVRDNGIGIAKHQYETVFQIFRRLHGRDEFDGGMGAGLTIVKKIVERHEGRLWMESEPGAGTTFYFALSPDAQPDRHDTLFSPASDTPH